MANTELTGLCAIIVDDEPNNLKVLELILRKLRFGPTYTARSRQALFELVDTLERVDLILQDLYLPGEDGYAILAQVRAHPKLARTKVIAITSHAGPGEMQRARQAGFDSFILKPVNLKALPDQIRDVMAGGAVWQVAQPSR